MDEEHKHLPTESPEGDASQVGNGKVPPSPMVLKYFLLLFLVSILALGRLLWPFLSILILSFFLAGIFQPVFRFLNKKMSASFASLLTCIMIFVLVFVPLFFFVSALSGEAFNLYQLGKSADLDLGMRLKELVQESTLISRAQELLAGLGFELKPESINDTLAELTKKGGLFLYSQASSWAANIMNFVFSFLMMILIIFFLLIDHDRFMAFIIKLSPLPDDQERQLFSKFEEIAGAVLIGNGICGLIQGVLGGLAFIFFGLGSHILWGGVMVILAFLPIFGIGLVLIPASFYLFLKGRLVAAIGMLIFYGLLSFSVEYLLKPMMVGERVKMHTLLVFLSILGGLSVYGVLGIIYGPLIVTAFLTLSEIYMENYDEYVQGGLKKLSG